MRSAIGVALSVAGLGTLCAAYALGQTAARPKPSASIVGVYGVGGVIAENGTLWQYMPDQKRWMTIDEAFRHDGRETHVLPLPVSPKEIRFMESWGFLVTHDGKVWHYDLDSHRWRDIGAP